MIKWLICILTGLFLCSSGYLMANPATVGAGVTVEGSDITNCDFCSDFKADEELLLRVAEEVTRLITEESMKHDEALIYALNEYPCLVRTVVSATLLAAPEGEEDAVIEVALDNTDPCGHGDVLAALEDTQAGDGGGPGAPGTGGGPGSGGGASPA